MVLSVNRDVSDWLILSKNDSSFDISLCQRSLDFCIIHSLLFTLWFLILLFGLLLPLKRNCLNMFYQLSVLGRRRQWHPTPVLLPGKSHGQRSLVGCSPWGRQESYTTEQLHFHFSPSYTGEGNGNPLQCSCLENPRDGEAWSAAVHGVAQSRTWLKRLSSRSRDL